MFGQNRGYFFLPLMATSLLSRKIWRWREICKNPEIRKNPEKSQACIREFCLANIFAKHFKTDYQPKYINFTCKFGWYPRKSAKQIFLVSNFLCLAALWNWPQIWSPNNTCSTHTEVHLSVLVLMKTLCKIISFTSNLLCIIIVSNTT